MSKGLFCNRKQRTTARAFAAILLGTALAACAGVSMKRTLGERALRDEEIGYFLDVALCTEYGNGGHEIKKWAHGMKVAVHGNPSSEDLATLSRVAEEINAITGRRLVSFGRRGANVEVYFVPEAEFSSIEPHYEPFNYGFVWAWWEDRGIIYKARILISTEGVTQKERSHLIREELTQSLGLLCDSWKYRDRIIEILYKPYVRAGMGRDDVLGVLSHKREEKPLGAKAAGSRWTLNSEAQPALP
jgi:hypothetical protein